MRVLSVMGRCTRLCLLFLLLPAGADGQAARRLVLEADVPVLASPDAALVSGSLSVEPSRPVVGRTAFFRVQVQNVGGCPLPRVVLGARGGPLGATPERLGNLAAWDTPQAENLPIGGTAEVVIRWDAPSRPGPHRVIVEADPDRLLGDVEPGNNRAELEFDVRQAPDLALTGIARAGDGPVPYLAPTPFRFTIENLGGAPSREVFLEVESDGENWTRTIPPLAPGERGDFLVELPARRRMTLAARVDRYNIEPEPDEENNSATAELTLEVHRRIETAGAARVERWSDLRDWSSGDWRGADLSAEGIAPHPSLSFAPAEWEMSPASAINAASPARDPATLDDNLWTLDDFLRAGPRETPPILKIAVRDARLVGRQRVFLQVLTQARLGRYAAGAFRFAAPGAPDLVHLRPAPPPHAPEYRDVPLGIYDLGGEFRFRLGATPGYFAVVSRLQFRPLLEYVDIPTYSPPGTRWQAAWDGGADGVQVFFDETAPGEGRLRLRLPGDWTSERGLPGVVWTWIPPPERLAAGQGEP